MKVATWTGSLVAALALACSGQQAENRTGGGTAAAQPRDVPRGSGASATASNAAANQGTGTASAAAAKGEVKELPDVRGRLTRVSTNEIEVKPESGDAMRLKVNAQTMVGGREGAITSLQEGQEVRASYDESTKTAIDVRPTDSGSTSGSSTGTTTEMGTGNTTDR